MYIGLLVSQPRPAQEYSPHHADMPAPDTKRARRIAKLWEMIRVVCYRLV
ncbi:hypothetical protein AWB67_01239 [Caballeronia terrestris]|jgi:hypothetical protein|uniref:Uncharacterized protein n=1 Tax=Caballeronia terrestris TaxID=1226301 RepID=A0A158GBA8_9BURK|nr:hypothetical protein [Caballeronia terrestris]SAL29183.1 hypothetical protein AWB67_01239 [Caballeronia terrestris]